MRPKQPEARPDDLFRSSMESILDQEHELVQLADLIEWTRFDDAFGAHYHDRKGWRGFPWVGLSRRQDATPDPI